jgi:uncharacterized membrane protein YccC
VADDHTLTGRIKHYVTRASAHLHDATLLRPLIAIRKRDVPWQVGLRNTAAVVLPLVAGAATHRLGIGLGIAVGALNTMFTDQPGPYRLRMRAMLLTALAAGVAAFAGSTLGQWPVALSVAAALWGFAAALLVAIGPNASRAGMTSMVLLVVLGAEPGPAVQALPMALLILAGGVLQTGFAMAAWPLRRYQPERLGLANAFRRLADVARQAFGRDRDAPLPVSLNDLQSLLFGTGRARGRAVEAFRVLAQLAERIRIELFALVDLRARCRSTSLQAKVQATCRAAGNVLETLAAELERGVPSNADAALTTFAAATTDLSQFGHLDADDASLAPIAASRATALGGQLRAAARNTDAAGGRGEIRALEGEFRLPRALRPVNSLRTLRANLNLQSSACRHAIRCGICFAIAVALSRVLPLSRGYWMPMTVAIVLKPDFGATWRYGLLRVVGTLAGLVLLTAILHVVGIGNVWITLALLAVLCFGFRELAAVHYGAGVVCLTGLVVILLVSYGVSPETSLPARVIDTVSGSALALLAYLLWPTWERGREPQVLARLLDAYRDYLLAVLYGDVRVRDEARLAARAARSSAQASLDRLQQEPASRVSLTSAEALVAQANRLVRAAMVLESARVDGETAPGHVDRAFAYACTAALDECATALRETRALRGDWHLREIQRELADSLMAHGKVPPSGWGAALLDASDRIVDAIDSVAHVLQR